jgi:predicted Zn-dependent protease
VAVLAQVLLLFSAFDSSAQSLVSVEEEIEIGRAAEKQMRQQVTELRDARVTAYVRDVGRRLVRAAPGAKYPYRFTVADRPEINAFSLPGGPIWVNRGVLARAANEAQAASVLAHEVAHVAARHGADRLTHGMVARWGLGLLGALLGNSGGATTAQAAATLLTGGVFLKFSRDEEREADEIGVAILTKAGWDRRGMVEMFELLRREAGRDPSSVESFLSSHPAPQDRIAGLARVAARKGGRRDSREFQAIRARLARR